MTAVQGADRPPEHPPGGPGPAPPPAPAPADTGTAELPAADGAPDALRAARRAFRPTRTVPAVLVAAVLAVVTLLAAAEVISHLVDRPFGLVPTGWLTDLGTDNAWDDPLTLTVAAVAVLLGLLLLWLAIWPGRSRVVPLAAGPAGATVRGGAPVAAGTAVPTGRTVVAITRGGVRRYVVEAAEGVDGITTATASVGRRRIRVRAGTLLQDPTGLAERVHRAVADRLAQLGPLRPPTIAVSVHHRKE